MSARPAAAAAAAAAAADDDDDDLSSVMRDGCNTHPVQHVLHATLH